MNASLARVRCSCGLWRDISVNRFGYAVETCGCGYLESLRGNPPAQEPKYVTFAMSKYPLCVSPGCQTHVITSRTDMCAEHCLARRKATKRTYSKEYMRDKAAKRKLSTKCLAGGIA